MKKKSSNNGFTFDTRTIQHSKFLNFPFQECSHYGTRYLSLMPDNKGHRPRMLYLF